VSLSDYNVGVHILHAAAVLILSITACEKTSSSELEAVRQELEEERELLKETRAELQALTEELGPLPNMAKMLGTYDLDATNPRTYEPPVGLDPLPDPVDPNVPPDDLMKEMLKGIKKVSDVEFRIDRKLVDKVLENPAAVARGARIVPSIKNGKPNGFKLYAIRPSSVYAMFGLYNGDTIHRINGFDLTSPDKALEVYTKLRDAKNLQVDLTRRGKPVTLRYSIR